MRKILFRLCLILCTSLCACNATRKLPEGDYLLVKNEIHVKEGKADKDELLLLQKQKPNRKVLFFRFHLGLYTLGRRDSPACQYVPVQDEADPCKKCCWFGKWLQRIGEEPVILDTTMAELTSRQYILSMFRDGYFNASCEADVYIKRKKFILDIFRSSWVPFSYRDSAGVRLKKKVKVVYTLHGGEPYFLRNLSFQSRDAAIHPILKADSVNTLLKTGDQYNEDVITNERIRITKELRNRGYYYFNRNFVNVKVDSSLGSHQVDMVVNVNRINENVDTANQGMYRPEDHKIYFVNEVFIQTDFDPANPEPSDRLDTSYYQVGLTPQGGPLHYIFLHGPGEERFRKKTIANAVFFKKGDLFFQDDLDYTYSRLSDLNVFRYTNIRYENAGRDSSDTRYLLNSFIQLAPRKSQSFSVESEVTHSGGNIGIAGSFGYVNWNTFRGAEAMEIKLHGSIENIQNFSDTIEQRKILGIFNTYEFGPEVKLTLKDALFLPLARRTNPRTTFSGSYTYQSRPDYKRAMLNFSYGENWKSSASQRWFVFPLEVSSVYVDLTPEFSDYLNQGTYNLAFLYSYTPHLITNTRVVWLFSNQGLRKYHNFWFMRGSGELAGQVLSAFNKYLPTDDDGNHQLFGLTYSQYFKGEIDVSYHDWLNENSSLVYRFTGGVGVSYANSEGKILPFEKAFYSGGANSIRAWNARTLGPGSFVDTTNSGYTERIGDVKLEWNVEYRSVIFKYLEGAVFVDMGNMWVRKDPQNNFANGTFQWSRLADDIAIGGGIGARLNFNFFIIRLDGGLKLRDPARADGDEWVYGTQAFDLSDVVMNFAIGYPF